MQNDKPTIEKRLEDYVKARDLVAATVSSLRQQELVALADQAIEQKKLEVPPAIEQRLEKYCQERDQVSKEVAGLHQVDLNHLFAGLSKSDMARETWLEVLIRRWWVIVFPAAVATACIVFLMDRPLFDGKMAEITVKSTASLLATALPAHKREEGPLAQPQPVVGEAQVHSLTWLASTAASSEPNSLIFDSTSIQSLALASASEGPSPRPVVIPDPVAITASEQSLALSNASQISGSTGESSPNKVRVAEVNAPTFPISTATDPRAASIHTVVSSPPVVDNSRAQSIALAALLAYEDSHPVAADPNPAVAVEKGQPLLVRSPIFRNAVKDDGTTQFNLIDPFGALMPKSKFINYTLTPVLALLSVEKNDKTHTSQTSFLWKFYRESVSPNGSSHSVLFGLFQHKVLPDGSKKVQLFGIHL